MRLLVCGSRTWRDYIAVLEAIQGVIQAYRRPEVVIHGAARGADTFADAAARYLGIPVEPFPITEDMWEDAGKAAGPIRNRQMLVHGKPTHAIGFADEFTVWSGTVDMLSVCDAGDVPVACLSSGEQVRYWVEKGCPFASFSEWVTTANGGPLGTA